MRIIDNAAQAIGCVVTRRLSTGILFQFAPRRNRLFRKFVLILMGLTACSTAEPCRKLKTCG